MSVATIARVVRILRGGLLVCRSPQLSEAMIAGAIVVYAQPLAVIAGMALHRQQQFDRNTFGIKLPYIDNTNGMMWQIGNLQHIIFCTGPAFGGPNQLQGYFTYQLTFGP
jgi:hypothetical protein